MANGPDRWSRLYDLDDRKADDGWPTLWVFDDATPTVIKLDDCGKWFKPDCAGRFIPPSRVSLLDR